MVYYIGAFFRDLNNKKGYRGERVYYAHAEKIELPDKPFIK
jgi:hypothetical protein